MTGYAIILLLYAGWRSFDYMLGMLSGVNETVSYLVAISFLFSSEIGLLIWLHKAAPDSTTDTQETTANLMVGINFLGSMMLGLADILKHNSIYSVDMPWLEPILLLAPWLLIASNVLGHIVYHRADAEEMLKRAERELKYQERKLHISAKNAAIQSLKDSEEEMARKLSPHYYADIQDRVTGDTMRKLSRQAGQIRRDAAESIQSSNGNGHKEETAQSILDSTLPKVRSSSVLSVDRPSRLLGQQPDTVERRVRREPIGKG